MLIVDVRTRHADACRFVGDFLRRCANDEAFLDAVAGAGTNLDREAVRETAQYLGAMHATNAGPLVDLLVAFVNHLVNEGRLLPPEVVRIGEEEPS